MQKRRPCGARGAADATAQPATTGRISSKRWGSPHRLASRTRSARRWYAPHIERIHEDAQCGGGPIATRADRRGYPTRERFLTELTLDPPDATSDQAGVPLLDEDYLILSTIHSAKGQEWNSVSRAQRRRRLHSVRPRRGTTEEIEEERRLLYVAMTRAKDQLHLMVPQRFFVMASTRGADTSMPSRTRFIPERLLGLFERTAWPAVAGRRRCTARQHGTASRHRRPHARHVALNEGPWAFIQTPAAAPGSSASARSRRRRGIPGR